MLGNWINLLTAIVSDVTVFQEMLRTVCRFFSLFFFLWQGGGGGRRGRGIGAAGESGIFKGGKKWFKVHENTFKAAALSFLIMHSFLIKAHLLSFERLP